MPAVSVDMAEPFRLSPREHRSHARLIYDSSTPAMPVNRGRDRRPASSAKGSRPGLIRAKRAGAPPSGGEGRSRAAPVSDLAGGGGNRRGPVGRERTSRTSASDRGAR